MKRILIVASVLAATSTIPALAADVGVSVGIGQPGFYLCSTESGASGSGKPSANLPARTPRPRQALEQTLSGI
jgi:hypothetical protein